MCKTDIGEVAEVKIAKKFPSLPKFPSQFAAWQFFKPPHSCHNILSEGHLSASGFIARQVDTYKEFAVVYLCKYKYKKYNTWNKN